MLTLWTHAYHTLLETRIINKVKGVFFLTYNINHSFSKYIRWLIDILQIGCLFLSLDIHDYFPYTD